MRYIGIAIILFALIAVLSYAGPSTPLPFPTPEPSFRTYSNPDLGISFEYPAEWGEANDVDGKTIFASNTDVEVRPYTGTEAQTCAKPKTIQPYSEYYAQGIGYCKLFENGEDTMIEWVRIGTLPQAGGPYLTQHAYVGSFEFVQTFPELADIEKILDRTPLRQGFEGQAADPAVLAKLDAFEAMILSLEIE